MTGTAAIIRTIQWMAWDTFRQALASRLLWVLLGLTALSTLLCLSVRVRGTEDGPRHPHALPLYVPAAAYGPEEAAEGIRVVQGEVSLGFGLAVFPIGKSRTDSVRWLMVWLAGLLADTAGVLLALLWTAGFVPAFLEPRSVSVLLAKPVSRGALLVGKYLGVVAFLAGHAILFVGGTWLGLGLSTGVWEGAYWLAVPLLTLHFAVFYAASVFLAVCSRGVMVPLFGTLAFWILCWAMNVTHWHLLTAESGAATPAAGLLVAAGYWFLPKPLDLSGLLFETLRAGELVMPIPEWEAAWTAGLVYPELSVATALLFAAGAVALAAWEFSKLDY